MKNLIIVEGIPGSGKSWTARFIATQLECNGYTPRLYHETSFDHPVISLGHVASADEWMTRYLARWRTFLSKIWAHSLPVVLEAAFYQNIVMNLLNHDVDRITIATFIDQLVEDLNSLDTAMIYLYQKDQNAAIRAMIEKRGGQEFLAKKYEALRHYAYYANQDNESPDRHLNFLGEYAKLVSESYERYPWDRVAIETSNQDWAQYRQTIAQYLGLAYRPEPIMRPEQLGKVVGKYRNDDMNLDITISLEGGRLIIFGDRELKPYDDWRFYLDAISVRVDFIVEGDRVTGLVVSEKDIFVNKNDNGTPFYRVS